MSFRIEEKIKLTKYDQAALMGELTSRGMKSLYSDRKIKSIYFDNFQKQCFLDAEEGVLPRKKIRIRSYPDDKKEARFFEVKTSSIEGRFKTVVEISEDKEKNYINSGFLDKNYGVVKPLVIVEYIRKYFIFNGVRVTLDGEIKYSEIGRAISVFENHSVLEIKTDIGTSKDLLENYFPYPRTRFSKYCNGVILLGLNKIW
ncbi:MAG: VTC domain-containing protein [Comamonas sp.]